MSKKKPSARPQRRSVKSVMAAATSTTRSLSERVEALYEVPINLDGDNDESLGQLMTVLKDVTQPVAVRLEALQTLQAATFSVLAFESCRGDYTATLRKVATDADPEIRQRALGMLARDKDGFAQKKLLEGLENPDKALVSPEKALQLLSYDAHSDAYKAARAVVAKPPSEIAKREALRLLSADATCASLFEKILRDKKETNEIRQISAAALQAIKPKKLLEHARELLMDDAEDPEMQTTGLTALTYFGSKEELAADKPLIKRVARFGKSAVKGIKSGAKQFLSKYGE